MKAHRSCWHALSFSLCLSVFCVDPLGLLIDRLPVRRSKKIVRDKIVELGLVADVNELRKKRGTGKGSKSNKHDSDESDDEEVENRPPREPGASDNERFTSDDDTHGSESDAEQSFNDANSEREGEPRQKLKKRKEMKDKKKKPAKSKRKQYGFGASGADSFEPEALSSPLRQLLQSGTWTA